MRFYLLRWRHKQRRLIEYLRAIGIAQDNRISVDAVNPPTPVEVPSGTFLLATAISLGT